ncbi:hypothetical protein [Streptomyces sp. DSM 40750]|uniref:hypothetical protein n=1 Tax=Streptomyces sp. DSM 40750 TaxID=2801030 RepID=UPI00214CE25C|nr:hypothetical protein [Streptomyces sp. DSM 40750]UUU20373.1 hypothetical protein JIX55_08665 [Streptomyces sp. DSM 40750]
MTGSQVAVNNGSVHQQQIVHQIVTRQISMAEVQAMADALRVVEMSPRTLDAVRQAAQALEAELARPVPDVVRLTRALTHFVAVTLVSTLDTGVGNGTPQAAALTDILRPLLPTIPGSPSEEGGLRG